MEDIGGSTPFPIPPMDLVKLYTTENVRANLAPPPPPPVQGHYVSFGQSLNTDDEIVQSLESQNIRRLYPQSNFDYKTELKKLNHSILASFLDLLEIMIRCPGNQERQRKLDDIKLLFINMHHLMNEFRINQARDTLKLMLEVQCYERLDLLRQFKAAYDLTHQNVKRCLSEVPESVCNDFLYLESSAGDSTGADRKLFDPRSNNATAAYSASSGNNVYSAPSNNNSSAYSVSSNNKSSAYSAPSGNNRKNYANFLEKAKRRANCRKIDCVMCKLSDDV